MIYIRVMEEDAMVNDMLYASQNIKIHRLPSQILCLANLKFRNMELGQFHSVKLAKYQILQIIRI